MDRYMFLLSIVNKLEEVGSWAGNTHIQKTGKITQSAAGTDMYEYVMHHYGPYSFDLRDDLDLLVNRGFVERQPGEKGFHYSLTDKGRNFLEQSEMCKSDKDLLESIDKICNLFGKSTTVALELISTVDYYINKFGTGEEERVVETVRRVKPHFSEEVIKKALKIWKKHVQRETHL